MAITPPTLTVTEAPQASATPTATPRLTETEPAFLPTPEISLSPTPALLLCSPLAWETIPELQEIVGDPYKPPPAGREEERHHGVDFSHYARKGHKSILGEPIQSTLPGVVAASITGRLPYGNVVIIETDRTMLSKTIISTLEITEEQSLYVLYAHMDQPPLVSLGEVVNCGQQIGFVGKVGYNVVNEHLHLEMRLGPAGMKFESMAFYTTDATIEEMEAYKRWRTGGEFRHFDPFRLFNLVMPQPSTGP